MLSDMKFVEVKYSRVPMPVRIIITCLAMSVLIASVVLFLYLPTCIGELLSSMRG